MQARFPPGLANSGFRRSACKPMRVHIELEQRTFPRSEKSQTYALGVRCAPHPKADVAKGRVESGVDIWEGRPSAAAVGAVPTLSAPAG